MLGSTPNRICRDGAAPKTCLSGASGVLTCAKLNVRAAGAIKHVALILVLDFRLLVIPVPFARLHDDEAIYFVVTGDLL